MRNRNSTEKLGIKKVCSRTCIRVHTLIFAKVPRRRKMENGRRGRKKRKEEEDEYGSGGREEEEGKRTEEEAGMG